MKRREVNAFRALGDPSRVRMIKMLQARELCVCEIREILGLSVSTVSKHLSILRDAGFITDRKNGKWVNFRLNTQTRDNLIQALLRLVRSSFNEEMDVREDRKKVRMVNRNTICGLTET